MNTAQNIECVTDLSLLVNTSLVDVVADKIRQNIYTGKYEAGKKLIVRELSEEFGVSHTPVKDALNRLISEGYVEALPRRSMVVRTYTNAELLDALEARMMCEIFYADAIIEMSKGHPELVKELKEVMATTRRLVAERGEHFNADWVANEVRFHRCYMLYCGNARVVKMHQDLGTNRHHISGLSRCQPYSAQAEYTGVQPHGASGHRGCYRGCRLCPLHQCSHPPHRPRHRRLRHR